MKFIPIKNQFNEVLAIHMLDFNIAEVRDIISLVAQYGVVFWKNTTVSLKEYNNWQLELGYHQYADIWCSHKEYPIFYRVTNRYVTDDHKGLFSDKELDWHSNILFKPDAEELVGLYAQTVPKGSKTFFANSIPYWQSLSEDRKFELNQLWVKITSESQTTYEKKLSTHYQDLPDRELKNLHKNRQSRDIRRSINFDQKNFSLYKEPRYSRSLFLKLIPNHPLGTKGLHFPFYHISGIATSDKKAILNHKQIYDNIKAEYILSGRYIYEHQWEKGDIVLADQLIGLHKRNNIWAENQKLSIKRELLRTACWYKTSDRKSFERSL